MDFSICVSFCHTRRLAPLLIGYLDSHKCRTALMSRAIAGPIETKVVFCLPGSPDASGLGMELIGIRHAVFIARGT